MIEDILEKAYELSKKQRRLSPVFLMRKLKITFKCSQKICHIIWLRIYKEARETASKLEFNGWPAQLDECRKKNIKKFKRK